MLKVLTTDLHKSNHLRPLGLHVLTDLLEGV